MKKSLYISLLLFLLNCVTSTSWAGVIIFIDAQDAGTSGDRDLFDAIQYDNLSSQYPNSNFIVIRPTSNEDLQRQLVHTISSTTSVDALVLGAHGGLLHDSQAVLHSIIGTRSLDVCIDLNEGDSLPGCITAGKAFAAIAGKFSERAKVIVDVCDFFEGKVNRDAALLFNLAKSLQIKNGSLYANSTFGIHLVERYFEQPFYSSGEIKRSINSFGTQLGTLFTFPAYYFLDQVVFNHGYRLILYGDRAVLYKDDLRSVEAGAPPGAVVARYDIEKTSSKSAAKEYPSGERQHTEPAARILDEQK